MCLHTLMRTLFTEQPNAEHSLAARVVPLPLRNGFSRQPKAFGITDVRARVWAMPGMAK
jgi:hypothetical protein